MHALDRARSVSPRELAMKIILANPFCSTERRMRVPGNKRVVCMFELSRFVYTHEQCPYLKYTEGT